MGVDMEWDGSNGHIEFARVWVHWEGNTYEVELRAGSRYSIVDLDSDGRKDIVSTGSGGRHAIGFIPGSGSTPPKFYKIEDTLPIGGP